MKDSRFAVGSGPLPNRDGKQLAGALHGINAKQEDVVDREHHRDEPEAECHRRDNGERGKWRASERAERVEDVARQVIDEGGAAGVATLVGGEGHRSESHPRPSARLGGAQAAVDVPLRVAFEVEGELFVELPLHPARRDQRLDAQLQIVEGHGGYASFITRPMAVDIRSHSLVSIVSCRRPVAVRR